MTPQERKDFANTCEEAISHPLVQDVIDEYRHNMRNYGVQVESGSFAYYGLLKCLTAATQVARAQALGIDPQTLLMTEEEAMAYMMRLAEAAVLADKVVVAVAAARSDGEG